MNWIFIIIGFISIISLFLFKKHSKRKFDDWRKNSNKVVLKNIRENWKEIKISTDNCTVINYNTKVNKNSPTYSVTNENESFYELLGKDPNIIDLVDIARSKVVCDYLQNGNLKKQYSTTVEMDKTVVEFKLRMNDFVSVYLIDESQEEDYFIDLEFLNEEIDSTKFK